MFTGRKLLRALLGASLAIAVLGATTAVTHADSPLSGNKPCASTNPAPPAGATKFLLAGDSIVHESRGDWTWRYFLYKQLVAANVKTDFVGDYDWLIDPNKSDWPYCDYQDPNFDSDFTASPGLKLADYNVANNNTGNKPWIRYEVETWTPDVLVMLAGANDLAKGASAADTLTAAHNVVTNAQAGNPNIKIVLVAAATGGPYDNKPNAAYDASLKSTAPGWSTATSTVVVTDPMTNWGTATYTWDQIHPNVVGEQLIAKGVADALHSLGIGNAGLPVDPAYKIGLRQPVTNATATQTGANVKLDYALPIGASGVNVVARDTTGGNVGSWFQVEDYTWFPGDIFGVGKCHESAPCTSYTITTLQAGHSYDIDLHAEKGFSIAQDVWAVKAGENDTGGAASSSPGAFSVTIPGTPPTPPGTPVLNAPTVGVGSVGLSWSAASGANQPYNVRYRTAGGSTYTTVTASGTSTTISGLTAGQSYGFQVQASKDGLVGDWSNEQLATPDAAPVKPAKPVVSAVTPGTRSVTLGWQPAADATAYRVTWRIGTGAWKVSSFASGTSRTVTGLVAGQRYDFRVQAANGTVLSDYSSDVYGTPKAYPMATPAKPVLKLLAGPKVKVTWRKVTGATRYLLQFHQVGKPWRNVAYFTGTTYISAKLAKKKSYEYRVVPYDGYVAGRSSAATRITTK